MQQAILDFWFRAPSDPLYGQARKEWFRKDDVFDASIASHFAASLGEALAGGHEAWRSDPRGALALVLLLDQFTRNAFRGTPQAFGGDDRALEIATAVVDRGEHRALIPVERWFMYMPFQHAEDRAAQDRSVELFRGLRDDGLAEPLPWAEKHAAVVHRFGRFPHRNAILGRPSTLEEQAFLLEPGSSF